MSENTARHALLFLKMGRPSSAYPVQCQQPLTGHGDTLDQNTSGNRGSPQLTTGDAVLTHRHSSSTLDGETVTGMRWARVW
jgi:hypothetical protein